MVSINSGNIRIMCWYWSHDPCGVVWRCPWIKQEARQEFIIGIITRKLLNDMTYFVLYYHRVLFSILYYAIGNFSMHSNVSFIIWLCSNETFYKSRLKNKLAWILSYIQSKRCMTVCFYIYNNLVSICLYSSHFECNCFNNILNYYRILSLWFMRQP